MTSLARRERFSLCDTFARTGPDAPTLCSPWTTADLAAHLVIRDRRPDLGVGIVLPPLAGRLEDGMKEYAAKPWPELVDLVRSGPPVWSPLRVPQLDDVANLSLSCRPSRAASPSCAPPATTRPSCATR